MVAAKSLIQVLSLAALAIAAPVSDAANEKRGNNCGADACGLGQKCQTTPSGSSFCMPADCNLKREVSTGIDGKRATRDCPQGTTPVYVVGQEYMCIPNEVVVGRS